MKIIICGNYGATNIGDELILKGILKLIDRKKHEITVLSANPSSTKRLHKVNSLLRIPSGPRSLLKGIFTLSFFRTLSEIKKCDLFILGGGSLFDDSYSTAPIIWGMQALAAYIYKKPIFILANGFGPLKKFTSKIIARMVCDYARWITVRDEGSKKLLENLGIKKKIYITADPVFGLEKSDFCGAKRNNSSKPSAPYILVTLREVKNILKQKELNKKFIQTFDFIHKKYGLNITLIPFQKTIQDDASIMKQFNKNFIQIILYTDDFYRIYELFENAEAVIGMRLHSIILAILTKKPFIAISSFDKIKNILNEAGMNELFLDLNKFTLKEFEKIFENFSAREEKIAKTNCELSLKSNKNKNLLTKALKAL